MLRRLHWRIAIPYVALILAATLGLSMYVSSHVGQARLADMEAQLLANARLLADSAAPLLQQEPVPVNLDSLAQQWADLLGGRVTIIGTDGTVLGESHEDRTQMDNHLNRPEVQLALSSGQGISLRYSATVGYEMMYAAVPVTSDSASPTLGVMRVSLPLRQIETSISRLGRAILMAGLVTALMAALLAILAADRISRPVRQLTQVARRLAQGDLNARVGSGTRDEVGQLAQAFNHMADQLRWQMTSLSKERGRLAAVLDHMADGVLITGKAGQVELINAAAARLLATSPEQALGRSFTQVAPHYPLIELWKKCRDTDMEQIETVEIASHGLFLQAIITPFQEADAQGYVLILQDLTRIRRLETVRRDFIGNISHELRTPLAGLRALVDTLRGGAINDPPAARRFLKRMDAEVDTLSQMVEELLELSRIESGRVPLRLAPTPVADVVIPPVDRLRPQVERAGLEIAVVLAPTLPPVLADVQRAQRVLTNLVHNAIKFTPKGGSITVEAKPFEDEVIFSVQDTGVGIRVTDLPRVFERFYKADRARSGGGTGLGLAIAKHIVQGHGGRIWAESMEGKGNTFSFTLPLS